MGKTQIRDLTRKFNLRTPVCKKNQIKRSNESQTAKETGFIYYSGSRAIFTVAKTCLSWLNGKRVSIQNSRRLNRLIPINERKVILERKSDQKSQSENRGFNPRKRKTTNSLSNERSLTETKRRIYPLKRTNGRKLAKQLNRKIKPIYF